MSWGFHPALPLTDMGVLTQGVCPCGYVRQSYYYYYYPSGNVPFDRGRRRRSVCCTHGCDNVAIKGNWYRIVATCRASLDGVTYRWRDDILAIVEQSPETSSNIPPISRPAQRYKETIYLSSSRFNHVEMSSLASCG